MTRPGPESAAGSELVAPSGLLGIPRPRYDGRSIVNLAVSAYLASGGEARDGPELAPPLARSLDPFLGRRAEGPVVVLLVDGLGYDALASWGRAGSTLGGAWAPLSKPITTVFPSTTTAALTSLSTGVPPGRHGLVGYRQYLPAYGMVADLLKMSPVGVAARDLLIGPEWRPSMLSQAPSLFRRRRSGAALTREAFRGTGFTRLLYDGAEFVGYGPGVDLAQRLSQLLSRPRPPPLIFAYWDELDTLQHLHGPSRSLVELEVERLAGLLAYVARQVPAGRRQRVTLMVTGDHGQVPATPSARIRLEGDVRVLRELARPLAGDRRAGFLSARPGRREALERAVRRLLPSGSRVIRMPEAVRHGLFGPPPYHPELAERLGDLLVLVPSPAGLTYRPPGAAEPRLYLAGAHGGLEREELVVPRVAGRLDEFLDATPRSGGKA